MRFIILVTAMASGLLACGGSSSDAPPVTGNPGNPVGVEPVEYEQLKPAQVDSEPLVAVAGDELSNFLKNGLRLQTMGYQFTDGESVDDTVDFSAPPASGDGGGHDYSDTNVHVAGVDEADVAKYDGQHWFVSYVPQGTATNLPGIQIFSTEPDIPAASLVGAYSFADTEWGGAAAMYLHKDGDTASQIVALRNQWGSVTPVLPGPGLVVDFASEIWPGPVNSELRLEFIDVNVPSAPELSNVITIDGALINSRRIGDTLYVVSRYDPWLYNLALEHTADGARADNEQFLQQTNLDDILPGYRIGDEEHTLADSCLVQSSTDENSGFYSLVNVTAIDLASQSVIDSLCVSSGVNDMTMSADTLYLTGNSWQSDGQTTTIHKFDLTDSGAAYSATGAVRGDLRGRAPYRVHQHEGYLRVVTSDWNGELVHKLFVMEQNGQTLDAVAELPNDNRPEAIGKTGEDIFAVRFREDQAYIVTFRRIDPFYVVDLANPLDPKITGELEIPGFSDYIHPINDQYIFTLGQNVNGETGWTDGIKAQLIEVAEGVPSLVGEVNIGQQGSRSEALYDLRALSFLPDGNGGVRIAFPVKVHARSDSETSAWQYSGLQMLELVGVDANGATLEDKGVLIAEAAGSERWDSGFGARRGLLHDQAVYYAHDNQLWFAAWGSPDDPTGPVGGEPIACTEEIRYGMSVTVWAGDDPCAAQVTLRDDDYVEQVMGIADGHGSCVFEGAAERAGTYDLTVVLEGYITEVHSGIQVSADACHVQTRYRHINLWANE
ncbi:beta-propeller domain-containing protein [Gilvimarinus sp. SDUM040013]|uniref:Beta-propeller domain-containing protein n=1 Tax=Gilvimarinus gilvus TaxID=3058038 RepID=A0ABU4S363_9GAMM|nr:beta-propeller domain-containing protein [Gilvimarinus sp. SDUM040013]MDO3384826.1 beta-propeller domain-containing protein [Gilvimarinus sp. SDUM040013]MDX6850841.1 beta-propeller domain-containing protein [Gilvimarinus sp. SDUM040013]